MGESMARSLPSVAKLLNSASPLKTTQVNTDSHDCLACPMAAVAARAQARRIAAKLRPHRVYPDEIQTGHFELFYWSIEFT